MKTFVVKELVNQNIEYELEKIGFDITYRDKASDKYRYKTLKIFDLTLPQANILKQTALSLGADCGVHRDILIAKIEKTDVILGGSYSQLRKICEKLKQQPFSLKNLALEIEQQLTFPQRKTKLVGILNVTPDSFSDGGQYFSADNAIKHINNMIEDGADIIDIGAESTKPNSKDVSAREQIERLKPLFKNLPEFVYSIDTRFSEVASFALDNGVKIVNDVSGLDYDTKMIDVVAQYKAGLVIQHSTGNSENIIQYNDVVEDIYKILYDKLEFAKSKGVENIILDVGIGFGKTREDIFEILNRIEEFYSLQTPIMVGISRKSFLGVKEHDNELKDKLTLAINYPLILKRIDYLRVHNVKLHKQLLSRVI